MGREQTRADHLHSRPLDATAAVVARAPAILGGSGAPDLDHLSRSGEVHPGGSPGRLGRCAALAARERRRPRRWTGRPCQGSFLSVLRRVF